MLRRKKQLSEEGIILADLPAHPDAPSPDAEKIVLADLPARSGGPSPDEEKIDLADIPVLSDGPSPDEEKIVLADLPARSGEPSPDAKELPTIDGDVIPAIAAEVILSEDDTAPAVKENAAPADTDAVSAKADVPALADGTPCPTLDKLRLFLMFCACVNLLGFPWKSNLIGQICGFAPIAFFLLSGYLVLGKAEGRRARIVRAIKRCAVVFVALTVCYGSLTLILSTAMGGSVVGALGSWKLWFKFLVLNEWPFAVGNAIWYVQALLYAYIIAYFLERLKLLRFDWVFVILLLAFAMLTGELAGIVRLNIFGYAAFSSNFFNRALPYILLGGFLRRQMPRLEKVPPLIYLIAMLAGGVLVYAEPYLFSRLRVDGYYAHLLGMAVIAVALCLYVFQDVYMQEKYNVPSPDTFPLSRWNINLIYYLCQPMGLALGFIAADVGVFTTLRPYMGLITFACCLAVACFAAWIVHRYRKKRENAPVEGSTDE